MLSLSQARLPQKQEKQLDSDMQEHIDYQYSGATKSQQEDLNDERELRNILAGKAPFEQINRDIISQILCKVQRRYF